MAHVVNSHTEYCLASAEALSYLLQVCKFQYLSRVNAVVNWQNAAVSSDTKCTIILVLKYTTLYYKIRISKY